MTDWKRVEAFCPKCGSNSVCMQKDAPDWPRFCCEDCDVLFNIDIFRAETVRIIDEA